MQIQVDTREHKSEWLRIEEQFKELGVQYFRSKLFVGDYMNLDNPRLVIDRKKDLLELCGNVCQQHERFTAELKRAIDQGIKIIILCEHGEHINAVDDVFFWSNPRRESYLRSLRMNHWKYHNLNNDDFIKQLKADGEKIYLPTSGEALYKSLCTIEKEYNVDIVFCSKEETGKRIVELLEIKT